MYFSIYIIFISTSFVDTIFIFTMLCDHLFISPLSPFLSIVMVPPPPLTSTGMAKSRLEWRGHSFVEGFTTQHIDNEHSMGTTTLQEPWAWILSTRTYGHLGHGSMVQ